MNLGQILARDLAIEKLHHATAVYTAEPIVDDLLDCIDWPRGRRRLADTSCGDGMFLGRALTKLLEIQPNIDNGALLEVLEGWELHPGTAAESRLRVATILVAHGRDEAVAVAVAARMVRQADFLTAGPDHPRYHALAGNPPYLRYCKVPNLLREEYLARLPQHACSDLLHSFLAKCAGALFSDGEIAFVTADRWLYATAASKLRSALGEQLGIHKLRRLDPATAFYRPKQRRKGAPPRIHPVAVVMRPFSAGAIRLTAAPVYPGQAGAGMAVSGQTLGDIAEVNMGPWLGAPGIFLVDRHAAAALPQEHLVPAIDSKDIRDGRLCEPRRFAIRTQPDIEPPQAILAHLEANLHRMAARGRRKQVWMPPESWHELELAKPSLFVPRIARSLCPVRIPAGVVPVNHNLRVASAGAVALADIEAFLASDFANAWMRAHAAPLEGGFYAQTAPLLRKLPIGEAHCVLDA